jgi:excisionase family DNA binding protein
MHPSTIDSSATSTTPWLSASEASRYLRMPSVRALYQAVRRGWVPAHRFGPRQLRFHRLELDRVLGAPAGDIAAR